VAPDISVAAAQSVAGKGLMLAETVADTDGQTLGILKYKKIFIRSVISRGRQGQWLP